jgi:mevalonate kinase
MSEVKESTIQKIGEWIQIFGETLKGIALKELKNIMNETQNYTKALNVEFGAIDLVK